jgi:hypothetical protein
MFASLAAAGAASAASSANPEIITLADASATTTTTGSNASDQSFELAQNTTSAPAPAAAAPAASTQPASTGTSIIYGRPQSEYTAQAVDKAIGTNPFARFFNYYYAEEGQATAPPDPNAPAGKRSDWPAAPQSTPPMPFTDWPYGGTTLIGDNRTASVDSPLMVALEHTGFGDFLAKTGIQAYGWVDVGGNYATDHGLNANSPAAYDYNPNTIQLDQAVIYVERTPDTVQTDHIDWGFRFSAIYGTDYHYTTSYGLASYQLLKYNYLYGYDFPMVYAELYVPKIADGLVIRVGRYISLPDIEAQLAPNNYMYSHSITYTFDNYTNTGIQASLALNPHIIAQLGVSVGTEAPLWHVGEHRVNPDPNPLFPGKTFLTDPGVMPSVTACARFDDYFNSDLNICADAINNGTWGYNNLQWWGATFYHKFNDQFHVSAESYYMYENNVPNLNNPTVQALNAVGGSDYGTPFGAPYILHNNPAEAYCKNPAVLKCTANEWSFLTYWNYEPTPLDNISLRLEMYDDNKGQRTGFKAIYYDVGLGAQHWLSPQVEFRPEYTYYWASAPSFGNGTKKTDGVLSGDVIIHF